MLASSTQPPVSSKPWLEFASNKEEKKRQASGLPVKSQGEKKRDQSPKKSRAKPKKKKPKYLQSMLSCFSEILDPRIDRRRRHLLIDIIVIATCAVICNADTWSDIAIWGKTHKAWLSKILRLPNGIPSRDTFRRTISRIDPGGFQQAFLSWVSGLGKASGVIAIDGKTLRGTKVNGNKPLHIVSAWASAQHLTLGQITTEEKSNEITAIPALLETLHAQGAIITIDAMGCQKQIARKIIDQGAEYCLAAKGNQPNLTEDISSAFTQALEAEFDQKHIDQHSMIESKRPHGRIESRYYYTMPVPDSLRTANEWAGLKSIGMTITYRAKNAEDDVNGEVRYYIMSFESNASRFAEAVRSHWGIENSLHWVMDVTFREDESRIRKDYGGENVSWLRRLAITLLKNETSVKGSIRAKRLRAGYDTDYLEKVLEAIPVKN